MDRIKRAGAFAEALLVSLLLQAALNAGLKALGVDLRLSFYEVALIWMFCK